MSSLNFIAPDSPPDAFPPAEQALSDPDGLVATGGDLSLERLLAAYSKGIFPWYDKGQSILWWSPDPRAFLFVANLKVSSRFRRTLRKADFKLVFDRSFREVVVACAQPRRNQPETWITEEMIAAYCALHAAGHAHSLELLVNDELVGGLYGVSIGRMFYAESMFSRISDASKIVMVGLTWQLAEWGFAGLDCQVPSPHLESMGCSQLPRADFIRMNIEYQAQPGPTEWIFDSGLISRRLSAQQSSSNT